MGAPARTLAARELARHIGGVRGSTRNRLGGGREAEHHERIVHFIGGGRIGPCLVANPVDRVRIEPSDVGGGGRIESAAHRHRPRAALLERRIVEEGVGTGVEDLRRERGGLGEVAGDDPEVAVPEPPHQGLEPVDVHRLGQRIGDGLLHQRMVGDGARPREVLGARDLVREHRGDQVLGLHALDVRRDLGAAPEPRDGQRDVGVPPPAHVEHRGVEQRLGEDVAHRLRREVAGDLVEREAVGFAEREHDRVLGRRRLELEVELPAEALAQRQTPGPVEAAAEPGVDDELHSAALVEEPLEHHRVAVGQGAQRGMRGAEIVDDLLGGIASDTDSLHELVHEPGADLPVGGGGAGRLESPRQPSEQVAHAVGELPGASRRLAEPEREVRRLAVRILHADRAALDAQDAPRRVAELEDVAGQALDREILVERAETGPVGLQHHVVVGVVGDRAARGHRGEAGAAPGAQLAVDDVAVQVRGAPAPPGRESAGEHRQELPPSLAVEIPVRPGAAHRREQRVLAPVLGRDHGDDLLREDVERMHRHVQRIELAAPHRVENRGALDQLVPRERKQPPLRGAVHRVAGTPGPLQEGRDGAGGAELADQIDIPDVDPELQRGGGHQRLEIAGLEALLGREPALARQAAVVRGDVLLPERLGERPRDPLRHAAGVDEHRAWCGAPR